MGNLNNETENKAFQPKGRYAIPFFIALTILTVVSFIIPLRPVQSYNEKRSLAEFPEFSWEALLSGSYFDDISIWFSDTFPGREEWITLSRQIETLHGYSEILIEGDIPLEDEVIYVPETTQPVPETTVPDVTEDHTIEVTEETLPDVELIETTPPTTPIEEWGGLNVDEAVVNIGAVIQIDDFALGYYSFSESGCEWYASSVNRLAAALEGTGVNLVSAPPPSAIGVMVENEYMEMLHCEPQDTALDYLHGLMDESVIKVDTVRALIPHNNEYLYFRTDHHWTALGAYYVYEQVMLALDRTPAPLENFEEWDQGEFRGSLTSRCANPSRLTSDNVMAYIPSGDLHTMLYSGDGSGFEWPLLSDRTNSDIGTKYMTFLAGDHALTVVTNNDMPEDGPNCLVVKDSYGNCFIPFLTENYRTVYAIDYRKYYQLKVSQFVEKYNIQDVILFPNLPNCQNADVNRLVQNLYK